MVDHIETLGRIVELVRTKRAVTRPEIMRVTDLGRTVITQRVDDGLAAGILREEDAAVSTGGRPSRVLGIRPDAGSVLAAVFGASRAHIAVADLAGRVIASEFVRVNVSQGPARVLAQLFGVYDRLQRENALPPLWCGAVGLPGPVDFPRGRTISPPIMPGWHDYPVRERLQEELGVPVWVDNDVNLMALGAWKETRESAMDDVLLVKVGTGVGAGLISQGRLHRGARGAAGDIGHMMAVNQSSVQCRCGKFGCLEAFAGGWALARDGREAALTGASPFLADALARVSAVSLEDVIDGAKAGDPVSGELITRSATLVGAALADLVSLFNPATVFVAGSLARAGDSFVDTIRSVTLRRSFSLATDDMVITRVSLAHQEGALGAAWLALDEIFRPQMLARWISAGSPRGIAAEDGPEGPNVRIRRDELRFPGEITPLYSVVAPESAGRGQSVSGR
ncbi:MAG TPA: ROK family protein [Microbacterium sp.]|uniref:ROK family protein n=1 Tax=Microbacterium sp. TaxID=51671 RepID=UPI002CDFB0D6|nr:ROK family protein [Microbacterium sp.]HWI30746.1 ROK family protein [Microbacterium sp.]